MDDTPNYSAKKQRPRNQRDRRKPQEKPSESSGPIATANNVSDPQPQRINKRQRNEAPTTSANTVASSIPADKTDAKVITEKENVTIDFSNLKRETEEIAKLTKKFAKRNISSNWHRYSAPEGGKDDGKTEEEAPADFSALIQVPASKGGHLQLKDEQDWSSASNEQLGGYFALNLKLLNQSLACIPLYEQLRLPKNMFSEEELKHFDNMASEARTVYNPDKAEDPNELVQRAITNLLKGEIDAVEDSETKKDTNISKKDVNILNDLGNNQRLLSIDLQPEIIFDSSPADICYLNEKVPVEKSISSSNIVNIEDGSAVEPNNEKLDNNKSSEGITKDSVSVISSFKENEIPETDIETSTSHMVSKIIDQVDETKSCNEAAYEISINTTSEIPQTKINMPESIIKKDPKDRRKNNRKTPVKDVDENKLSNVGTSLKLEDDDDLDFLLSLKKPDLLEKKLNSVPNKGKLLKDSTVLPGNKISPQASSNQHPSELDDWLDSVLQD